MLMVRMIDRGEGFQEGRRDRSLRVVQREVRRDRREEELRAWEEGGGSHRSSKFCFEVVVEAVEESLSKTLWL